MINNFAIISPTHYLNNLSTKSSYHLALAHLVIKDETYASFYRGRSEAGDYVVLDNSAFELGESFDPEKLIELAVKIKAHSLVLPDYPGRPSDKTIAAAEKYIPRFKQANLHPFFVPQGSKGDFQDLAECYRWGANHKDVVTIGMSILAMPYSMPHINPAYVRVVATQRLMDMGYFNTHKRHHYLGLINASLEIPTLVRMGALNYCDSSNPVWAARMNLPYDVSGDSYLSISKKNLPEVDFSWKSPPNDEASFIQLASRNIDIIIDMFAHPEKHR